MSIDKTKETFENLENCNHQWDFSITPMKDSNLFIEKCLKCCAGIETLEIFPK